MYLLFHPLSMFLVLHLRLGWLGLSLLSSRLTSGWLIPTPFVFTCLLVIRLFVVMTGWLMMLNVVR
jgi:hypothetical protein